MEIRVEHVALWVRDLEGARDFFTRHLGARAGEKYQNPRTGFSSYFLTFDSGARLEVMTRPDLADPASSSSTPRRTASFRSRPTRAWCRPKNSMRSAARPGPCSPGLGGWAG